MPSQIANVTPIRSSGWSIRAFASFITGGTPIVTAEIIQEPIFFPVFYLAVNILTGSETNIRAGMRVDVYSVAGAFKGRTRIRYGNTITANVFPIRESSNAKLLVEVGDLVYVYKEIRESDKLVAADETFSPDGTPYSDQGSNPPPVACSGGHDACRVDVGQTYATVLTTGSTSYTVDPDSAGTVTHLWTLVTGVAFAPGSANTDANPTLRVNVGEYCITHAVTDSSNSKTTTQFLHLKVHDAANPPHQIRFTPDTSTADSGFGGTVEIVSGLTTQAAIPDGCLCIVWSEARNDALGSTTSYRNTANGRAHILCVGIVRRDNQSGAQDGSRKVSFEVISPLARLKELTSYSKVMEANATPDAWAEVKTLGVKRAIIQLIQFYTTLIESGFDLIFDSAFIDYLYPALYLQRSTFVDQVKELADGVDARMVCDRTGRFNIHADPKYIPLASRAAITKTWHFLPRDILSYEFPREHADKVEKLKASGFTGGASGNTPLFSLYPGEAPGEGTDAPTRERLIVTDQDDLNARTGRYGAAADVVYQDADGLRYRAFPLTLTLRGVYDFFDFSKEYVDFTTTLPRLARDVDLTKFLFCLQSTSVGYDYERGTATTTCVFDVVTNAAPGETFIPVDETTTLPPVLTPSEPYIFSVPTGGGLLGRGTANLAVLSDDGNLYFVDVRTAENEAVALGVSGTPIMWILDAFHTANAVIVTTTNAYTISDIFTTQTIADSYALRYTTPLRSMQSGRGQDGLFAIASHQDDGRIDLDVTLDSGASWTRYADIGGIWVGGSGDGQYPGCYVYEHSTNSILFSAFVGSGSTVNGQLRGTTNAGSSTSAFDGNTIYAASAGDIHSPFQSGEAYFLHGGAQDAGGFQRYHLYKTTAGGVRTDISPTVSGAVYGPFVQFSVKTCDADAQSILLVGRDIDTGGTAKFGVFLSRNGGATWATLFAPTTSPLYTAGTFGSDRDNIWLWGGSGALAVSYDGAATWKDLTISGAGTLLNIIGKP